MLMVPVVMGRAADEDRSARVSNLSPLTQSGMAQSESIAYLPGSKGGQDFMIITWSIPCYSNVKVPLGPCVISSRSLGRNIIVCDESLETPSG